MKFEVDKMVKKSEKLLKKGEELAKDMMPKVKDTTSDLKDSLSKSAQKFMDRKEDAAEDAADFAKNSRKEVKRTMDYKTGKKGSGKLVAGVAIAAAAAAAYTIHKKNKAKNESLKKEYSQKLTRWAELDLSQIDSETDGFQEPMKVVPKKVYKVGTNAVIDDLVINISNPSDQHEFNPEDIGHPVADTDIRKMVMDKTESVREKLRTKMEEGKLQAKLGTMEAKDKYVEIKDVADEKIGNVRAKVEQDIMPNITSKAEDMSSDVQDQYENIRQNVEYTEEEKREAMADKAHDTRKKYENLKNNLSPADGDVSVPPEATLAEEAMNPPPSDTYDMNEMSYDGEIEGEDNLSDKPFGSEETMSEDEEKEGIKDKVKHMAENAKSKIMPEKNGGETELVEYKVTLHNKGDKECIFNPMQIQLFDIMKRSVHIMAKHEEGTTLGRVTLKPGETYTGKLFVKKSGGKREGILFFKDLSLEYPVLFLTQNDETVESNPSLVLDEDYLYSDKEVLDEHNSYKRL